MVTDIPDAARALAELDPRHDFFVGIDSDGCAFDTMELKHKECFTPEIIKHWGLQAVSKYAREASEFVNLYSKWRGINRWPALLEVFDLLRQRPEVARRGVEPPRAEGIRDFVGSGLPLSNDGLRRYIEEHDAPELRRGLVWSEAVNSSVAEMVHGVPPFPWVRESLALLADEADMIVVSATPAAALSREWEEHDLARFLRAIAGQEMGPKALLLDLGSGGRYEPDRVLMIGDAPGDLAAARANKALFFPINPGQEEASWQRFYEEGGQRFLEGGFRGDYEASLISEFERLLPEVPPWQS